MEFDIIQVGLIGDVDRFYAFTSAKIELAVHGCDYGSSIERLRLCASVAWDAAKLTSEEKHAFGRLPEMRFGRKAKTFKYFFLSRLSLKETGSKHTLKILNQTQREVLELLPAMKMRLTEKDDFDFDSFYDDIQKVLTVPFKSLREAEKIDAQSRDLPEVEHDPWVGKDVDHPLYHRAARGVLDKPFFWDTADDLAPHGSNQTADILSGYLEMAERGSARKRKKKVDSISFLEATLESLGFVEGILARPHSTRDKKLYERDAWLYYCYNASVIAVALAEIKLTSRCSSRLAGYGLAAIARQLHPFARDVLPPEHWPRYERNLRDTRQVLMRFK